MRKHTIRLESTPLTEEVLRSRDCVLICTDHSIFDWEWIVEHSPLVVDTRNATRDVRAGREKIVSA
jgi:UDP-N-acetyl-D-mannosaminuronate dehydrogenase